MGCRFSQHLFSTDINIDFVVKDFISIFDVRIKQLKTKKMNKEIEKLKVILSDCEKSTFWLIDNYDHLVEGGVPLEKDALTKQYISFRNVITMVYLMDIHKTMNLHRSDVTLDVILLLLDNKIFDEDELDYMIQQKIYFKQHMN